MVDWDWKPVVYLTHRTETHLQLLVSCVVWLCGVRPLCVEKEDRGGKESSGCLWFVLVLSKTLPAGYLEQVNSAGWPFCVTHWWRWIGYCHRDTIQNWGREGSVAFYFCPQDIFLSILCRLVKGLCVFLQFCVWWGVWMVVALVFVFGV